MTTAASSYLETLPCDIMGEVLFHLLTPTNKNFGRSIKALSLTNKKIYQLVNHEKTMAVFFSKLKVSKTWIEERVAANLNTEGSRSWLLENIKNKSDTTTYLRIYSIFRTVNQLIAEMNLYDPTFTKGFPVLKPIVDTSGAQIKDNIKWFFSDNLDNMFLSTPFGSIYFFNTKQLPKAQKKLSKKVIEIFKIDFSINKISVAHVNRDRFALRRIWYFLKKESLNSNPLSINHSFKDGEEIFNGIINLMNRLIHQPNIAITHLPNGEIESEKRLILESIEELSFANELIAKIVNHFFKAHFDCSSLEINFLFRSEKQLLRTFQENQQKFESSFSSMRRNWEKIDLLDCPLQLREKLSPEFTFYRKLKQNIEKDEIYLLEKLADALGMGSSIILINDLLSNSFSKYFRSTILGIRKDTFERVVEKLNLSL